MTSGCHDVASGVVERGRRSMKPMPFANFMESMFGGNSDAVDYSRAAKPPHEPKPGSGRGLDAQDVSNAEYSRAAKPPHEPQPGSGRDLDAEDAANAQDEQARQTYLLRLELEKQTADMERELAALQKLIDKMPEDINRWAAVRHIRACHETETCIPSDTKRRSRKRKGSA